MSITPSPADSFSFPATKKIYGVVITKDTKRAEILRTLDTMSKLDGDLVLFLSVLPHDVTTRVDWELITKAVRVRGFRGEDHQVRYINESDIDTVATQISVLKP
jgi:hypothetical protein